MTDNTFFAHMRLSGEFRAVLNEGSTREVDTGWRPNLVLNAGLDRIGSGSGGMFNFCSVGEGTTAPSVSQTGLAASVASQAKTSSSAVNLGSTTYAGQYTSVYTFAQGTVVGNIAELGVGWLTGGSNLFSRCLIVDGSGTPTTLTVTSLDQLTVYYRLTNTPAITDLSSSVTLSGTAYSYTARLANAANFFNAANEFEGWAPNVRSGVSANFSYPSTTTIGAITSTPSGTASDLANMTSVQASYTNGNFYRETTITVPPSDGNSAGGIGGLLFLFGSTPLQLGSWQAVFGTPIPKDNTKTLTIVLRYAWGR